MNILVTGATSFIGKHLLNYLTAQYPDYKFIGTCNHSPNDNFNPKVDLYYSDLSDPRSSEVIRTFFKPDFVFHLAAISSPSYTSNQQLWKVNVDGTYNLLRAINCPIIFASTANIWGEYPHYNESLTTMYAASKRAAEALIEAHVSQGLIPAAHIFRLTGVVGEGLTHGFLHTLIEKIKKQENPLKLLKCTVKNYIYIDDVIQILASNLSIAREKGFFRNTIAGSKELSATDVVNIAYPYFYPDKPYTIEYSDISYPGDIQISHPALKNESIITSIHPKQAILKTLEFYK